MHAVITRIRGRAIRLGIVAAAVLLAAGGAAYALSSGSPKTISACAAKRSGTLRLLATAGHCKHSERLVTWNQQGRRGPAGTVNTSNFYTKGQSDGRYLSLHGTADNANKLAGQPASGYVGSGGGGHETLRFANADVSAGTTLQIYPSVPIGQLNATCNSPATSWSLQYVFHAGSSGHIERTHGTSTTFGTSDSALPGSGDDHVEYLIDYDDGTIAKLDVWVATQPDGINVCRFQVFATIVG